jgi:citrate synthase
MKKIFKGRYSLLIYKKDFQKKNGEVLRKGEGLIGGCASEVKNENNIITERDKSGEIVYQGINHVDCVYKRFSFQVVWYFIWSEWASRERAKFRRYCDNLK